MYLQKISISTLLRSKLTFRMCRMYLIIYKMVQLTRHFLLVVCDENDPECENFFPQCLHKKGFSPVWIRSCSYKNKQEIIWMKKTIHFNLSTTTTLGTPKKWPLFWGFSNKTGVKISLARQTVGCSEVVVNTGLTVYWIWIWIWRPCHTAHRCTWTFSAITSNDY